MAANNWVRIAALSGATAVTLGALGAHMILKKDEHMKDTWKTASLYHFIHTTALLYGAQNYHGKHRNLVLGLFLGGIVLFSGSLYTIVIMDSRQPFAKVAPIGGMCFIAGWLALGFL